MNFDEYFKDIEEKVNLAYEIAKKAREKGLDPSKNVEIKLTKNLYDRVIGLVSSLYPQLNNELIKKRIIELEKEHGYLELAVALKIAREIAEEKFCKFSSRIEAMEAGIRTAFAYITLGIVSSPIEGFIKLEERERRDGKKYIAAFFAGPIRSAGGTAASLCVVMIDYLRNLFGYSKYDATEEEIKRSIIEIYDYHERVTNLQYLPSEDEISVVIRNIPVQIEGEPSEEIEVSNYKDLDRVSTNRIRSGFCLVVAEGICLKASKIIKKIEKLKQQGIDIYKDWEFLKKLKKEVGGKNIIAEDATYIKDIVAGRPILSHPSRRGGFRLRYGRTRISGYSATAINPALTYMIDDFLAIGTQLRTERPGKSSSLAVSDYIDGPIVKLLDDSVVKIDNIEDALKYKKLVKEIIYLGDLLISYGDFFNRNHTLMPSPYVEEWWFSELKEKLINIINNSNESEKNKAKNILENLEKDYNYFNLSFYDAINLCKKFNLPLYPKYIFFWKEIDIEQLKEIYNWVKQSYFNKDFKLILPYPKFKREEIAKAKRALELIGLQHMVFADNIIIDKIHALSLLLNLGIIKSENINDDIEELNLKLKNFNIEINKQDVLDFLNSVSEFEIRDKCGTFIGARMGRPEKAKPRVMKGQPNCLFPVSEQGGRLRSINEALEKGFVLADFCCFYCSNCKYETIYPVCEKCNKPTEKKYYCEICKKIYDKNFCEIHGKLKSYRKKKIDIKFYFDRAIKRLNLKKEEIPELIKGVRGTSSLEHIPENLVKGILRAIYGLNVNKDGTIRYDATELPITHFKAREISTSIEKLKELGYKYDIYGNPLENEDQLLALMPQDVILPASKESLDERADKFFVKVANFIDDLLVKFYKIKPFYNVKNREDLIGHLILCIAPHNAAGTVARIIGFSDTQTFLAHPFLHAALRRDCDGDEAGFMLLLDALINFSISYIPSTRGVVQDCPIVANIIINQKEVDDMVFDMENISLFPRSFYEATLQFKDPSEVDIPQVKKFLDSYNAFLVNFTHPCSEIKGNKCSAYKKIPTMEEKVKKQMELGEKIRAVDESHLASLIITRHFVRDIRGNLRKFSIQEFRCVQCNEKYRRPPLSGKCLRCGGRIIFTIAEGTIKKYLQPALDLANKYNVSNYIKQTLDLIKINIETIFGKEEDKQTNLKKWF
ncbi:MAG: DNA polymerase II large subunit [Candidatus Pacearchaeota archaeon]